MVKNFIRILSILFFCQTFSQGIVVDTITYTVPQLVSEVLMQTSCANETNFQYSSGLSIGRFTNTNPLFPITEGIVIRNGMAQYSEGPYTGENESTEVNTNSDPLLTNISSSSGQQALITDVAFLEFDFTPVSSNFSFNFVFASNEYGEFQCGFSDVFGFFLTNLTTNETTNLAVVPNTATPISVLNIRDSAYNQGCLSQNPQYFGRYNVDDPANAAVNFRGETVLLSAYAEVIPNTTYRIRMAIGDYIDSDFDSAVFIQGGNFTTATSLGNDRLICDGQSIMLETNLGSNFNYTWTLDGVEIPGANEENFIASVPGIYSITATLPNSSCEIYDEVTLFALETAPTTNIVRCNNGEPQQAFNLLTNNLDTLDLDPAFFSLLYFASLEDANNNAPSIPANQLGTYMSAGGQTIYIKVVQEPSGIICDNLISFDLIINPSLNANTPNPLQLCNTNSGVATTNLNQLIPTILAGMTGSYQVRFYTTQTAAINGTGHILNTMMYPVPFTSSPLTLWVRIQDTANPLCFDIINFPIIVNPIPPVDTLPTVVACDHYVLPVLENGNYYTGSNGTGVMLQAGDVIINSGTYFIFNNDTVFNGCTNESFFSVQLIVDFVFNEISCGTYIVPGFPEGEFYTEPNAGGTLIPSGTIITEDQTIYFYAEFEDEFCREETVNVTILPIPEVGQPEDAIVCDAYQLPIMPNVDYYLELENGITLMPGTTITESFELLAIVNDGNCTNQHYFTVTIIETTTFQFPIEMCGSFTLPTPNVGSYFTAPAGGGDEIAPGTTITSSQIIYYYAETTATPNCTDTLFYNITINEVPEVDIREDILACGSYTLPAITNGQYYTATNGGGTLLNEGYIITSTRTVYIFNTNELCTNESSFLVEIRPFPQVENFNDIVVCAPTYTLPNLTFGTYYTAPGGPEGNGNIIPNGTVISDNQTIYIYNAWPDFTSCSNESFFDVIINYVDIGTFANVLACDQYILQNLNVGNYYTAPNGQGEQLQAGTILTTDQTVYVFESIGDRILCNYEASFNVTITETPTLDTFTNITRCGSYTLPPLTTGSYFSEPNGSGNTIPAGTSLTDSQTVYVYASATENPNCFIETSFNVTIFPLNTLTLAQGYLCIDLDTGEVLNTHTFNTGLSPNIFTVEWYFNGALVHTGVNFTTNILGTFDVIIIKNTPDVGNNCGYLPTTATTLSSSVAEAVVSIQNDFDDQINVIVTITAGIGVYEYQLGNGPFQSEPIFYNVPSGQYQVTIRDILGNCGSITLTINVLKYPKYFTPNGDGANDTWHIWDLFYDNNAIIYIYDRYGKLIKQLRTGESGWDGTYNGRELPSTDYWFQAFYTRDGISKEFKAHFSLKR